MAERKLTLKQRRFCEAYAQSLNATQAGLAAGAKSAEYAAVLGHRMLKNAKVKAYIAELTEAPLAAATAAAKMGADETLERLAMIARADAGVHLSINGDGDATVVLDPKQTGILREITSVRRTVGKDADGNPKVELETKIKVADPLPALNLLARHHRLIQEKAATDSGGVKEIRERVLMVLAASPETTQMLDAMAHRVFELQRDGNSAR